MKILLVDNGTSYLEELKRLLFLHHVSMISFSEITERIVENFDVIILSGGHNFPIVGSEDKLKKEINLIKNCQKPIFGICFGFELVAFAFGAELREMSAKENGIIDIEILKTNDIFSNMPNFKVFENHRWVISEVAPELIPLAKSRDGIEAIKHKTRPIYAVQFHPELFIEKTCGDEILNNFLSIIAVK